MTGRDAVDLDGVAGGTPAFQWELAPVLDTIWFAGGRPCAAIMALAPGMPDPAAFGAGMIARRFERTLHEAPPVPRARLDRRVGKDSAVPWFSDTAPRCESKCHVTHPVCARPSEAPTVGRSRP